ncbi:lysylphosphatidylglycerol synthase transmembrane domain-containing protein [Actinomadura sp. 9N407]|uniref:lysylphosphatidylglycerol synthase transmembrane domain-containing protein n=1 Tax=Actinomadura sp. 9N407 TaxID=3375154 RepID=UPI0037B947AE
MSRSVTASTQPALPSSRPSRRPAGPLRSRRALLHWCLAIAAVLLLVLFRDRLPDFGAMWHAATRAHPAWIAVIVLAEAISMGAFARLQRRLLRIGGIRMTLRRAFAVTYAGNALSTTLPAGPAVSVVYTFRQFRRSGATAQLATAVILIGGVITSAAYTVIALLALLAAPQARGAALVALLVPVVLVLVLARRGPRARLAALASRAGRRLLAHRRIAPHADRLREGREVLRPDLRDWGALVLLAVVNWLFDILALFAAARAVGIEVAPHAVALAYFAAQAAGSLLPLLPGGLGAIESSMAASLVALGAALAPAGAAVGLYRLVSYVVVVAVGWLAWATLHEGARLGVRTKRFLTFTGRTMLDGLSGAAMVAPYATAHSLLPPHTRRT